MRGLVLEGQLKGPVLQDVIGSWTSIGALVPSTETVSRALPQLNRPASLISSIYERTFVIQALDWSSTNHGFTSQANVMMQRLSN